MPGHDIVLKGSLLVSQKRLGYIVKESSLDFLRLISIMLVLLKFL